MNLVRFLFTILLAAGCSGGQPVPESVTEHAQRIDVQQLDASLPSKPLAEWLREGPARDVDVRWRQTECGLKHAGQEPAGGYPLCADFMFEQSGVSVRGSIVVGTVRDGTRGRPKFTNAWISTDELSRNGRADIAHRLSEIPALIAKYAKP